MDVVGEMEIRGLSQLSLPPGFRFYPTDEELMVQYLCRKVAGHHFNLGIIADIDLYKFDPWFLPSKAIFGEKEWYFFSPRDRKYPNGSRPNRVAGSGYWKATGTDKVITTTDEGRKVGIKKALVFYVGKAPKGVKTNWIMHEYKLFHSQPPQTDATLKLDEWVLCRIYKKNSSGSKPIPGAHQIKEHSIGESSTSSSQYDDVIESLIEPQPKPEPEIDDRCFASQNVNQNEKINLQTLGSDSFDWVTLAGLNPLPELGPEDQDQAFQLHGNVIYGGMNSSLYPQNDCYVSKFAPQIYHVEQDVQSGIKSELIDNSLGLFPLSSTPLHQGFGSSVDPFGNHYLTRLGSLSFMH